jgi:hypothetical protein
MSDQDKYTQNLIVKSRRKSVEVNPETEEAFEESKELVKESVRQGVKTNMAFVAWMGIFCWRLIKHGFVFLWANLSKKNRDKQCGSSKGSVPGQGSRNMNPRQDRNDRFKKQ